MNGTEPTRAAVADGGRGVDLAWSDGIEETLPAVWLGDNADQAFDGRSGQRRLGVRDLAFDAIVAAVTLDAEALTVTLGAGQAWTVPRSRLRARRARPPAAELWLTPAPIQAQAPIDAAAFLRNDDALGEMAARVAGHGLAILTGGPAEPGHLERIVARFGYIRETNYGRLFDVKSEPRPSNLAYTAEALDLHTDNPYREPPPTLQLLHAIRADPAGGATCFVDGFAHARAMAQAEPQAFDALVHEPVDFAYRGPDGSLYRARAPVIEQDLDGELVAIRFNHRSLAPLAMPASRIEPWYGAYRAFHRRLHAPGAAFAITLQPGQIALFDNRRILHGRAAFDGQALAGRWLQGCYADMDGLRATWARLRPGSPA